MNNPHFKWSSYNLNIACEKCGDRIIFQNPGEKIICKSCGNKASYDWKHVLDYVKLEDIKKQDNGSKNLIGAIEARSKFDKVDHINCYHCKSTLDLAPEMALDNYSCTHCNKSLAFENIKGMHDLVFYLYKTDPNAIETPALVAVKCVSCGAPLEADPTKPNYHCKFCSTENILPLSLRFKVVVNDIYIGERRNFFPKELVFSKDPADVLKGLKKNGLSSLNDEELKQILKNHLANTAIYFEIIGNERTVPREIEEEVFLICSNPQHIKIIGHRLNKSIEEIDARIKQVNPGYQSTPKVNQKDKTNKEEDKQPPADKKTGFFKRLFG
jgi:ribosomal protein S27E